jgi:aldehyde:ferredoxin oxidoreductase
VTVLHFGYAGQVAEVDLSAGKIVKKTTDRLLARGFLGGLGFAAKMLFDLVDKNVCPFSPENIIVMAPGALTGTGAPTCYRTETSTKSPLTGIIGSGNFGGDWGTRLKKAGYDALIVKGASRKPVYIRIDDSSITIEKAEHLVGKDTWETTDTLSKELGGDTSVLAIGQAGENLVRFACPIIDYHHAAGRSHVGCVMGAKRLKGITVHGSGEIAVANPQELEKTSEEIIERIRSYPDKESVMQNLYYFTRDHAELGHLGCLNYQTTILPEGSEIFDILAFKDRVRTGFSCGHDCPLGPYYGCNIVANVRSGKFTGLNLPGVIYTLPQTFYGAKCGIRSVATMWKCRELCQRYGMDESGPIPFALELFQRRIITEKDTCGLELRWGDEENILELLRQIAFREDFGDVLADGSSRAAARIGHRAHKYAMVIKNMEIQTSVDPRIMQLSTLLGHLTCARGADDLKSTHTIVETLPRWAKMAGLGETAYASWFYDMLDLPVHMKRKLLGNAEGLSSLSLMSKVYATRLYEDLSCIFNSLGICLFAVNKYSVIGLSYSAKLYKACVGANILDRQLYIAGERILNLMKAFAVREGLTRKDDHWPSRFYEEPIKDGPLKGSTLSKRKVNRLLDKYYALRGWNVARGVPTANKLNSLGLTTVGNELANLGLL